MDILQNKDNTDFSAFRWPYVGLLLFTVLLGGIIAVSEIYPSRIPLAPEIQQVGTALTVGVFSSYLTAVLVDGTFRKKEERDRRQMQNAALSEFRNPLNTYLSLLRVWYRCSLDEVPESPPDSFKQVLESGEIEKVRRLNLAHPYPAIGVSEEYTFLTDSVRRLEDFQNEIDELLHKYAPFLEPELVNALQELRNSDLFRMLITFEKHNIGAGSDYAPLFAGDGYLDVQENIEILLDVIDYYEQPQSPELTLLDISNMWRDDEAPKIGSAKIDVPFEAIQEIPLSDEPPHHVLGDEIWDVLDEHLSVSTTSDR